MAAHTDPNRIQVMDTTLRDGEQTPDIAYTPEEKLQLARILLGEVNVDRIEIAQVKVSEGEAAAARRITSWARKQGWIDRIEILGLADGTSSVDWIASARGKVLNLLVKGSEAHCRGQLGVAPKTHRERVSDTVAYARKRRMKVNAYLEDWSNGVRDSFGLRLRHGAVPGGGGGRAHLPARHPRHLLAAPGAALRGAHDRHLARRALRVPRPQRLRPRHRQLPGGRRVGGARCAHERQRTGRTARATHALAEVVAALHDQTGYRTGVDESRLDTVSSVVESFSGKDMPGNTPIVGRDVFTRPQASTPTGTPRAGSTTAGSPPERFGRRRRYALGKLSGKASLNQNLKDLGIELPDADRDLVLRRIVELGDKKHTVVPEDLPYIIAGRAPDAERAAPAGAVVPGQRGQRRAAPGRGGGRLQGREAKAQAQGDGGYDAFMNALKKALRGFRIAVPRLVDYRVRIRPGGARRPWSRP